MICISTSRSEVAINLLMSKAVNQRVYPREDSVIGWRCEPLAVLAVKVDRDESMSSVEARCRNAISLLNRCFGDGAVDMQIILGRDVSVYQEFWFAKYGDSKKVQL